MLLESHGRKVFAAAAAGNAALMRDATAFRKAAVALLTAALKHRQNTLADLREMARVLSEDVMEAAFDELNSKAIAGAVKKYDKAESAKAVEDPGWARIHALALALGTVEPTPIAKTSKAKTPRPAAPQKPVRTLSQSKAMRARNKTIDE
jgi:hypothetical protein